MGAVFYISCDHSPEVYLHRLQKKLISSYQLILKCFVVCNYNLNQTWDNTEQTLKIIYFLEKNQNKFEIKKFTVSPMTTPEEFQGDNKSIILKSITVNFDEKVYKTIEDTFEKTDPGLRRDDSSLRRDSATTLFCLDQPFIFHPVFIPKPWGQEIWYTGVEKRGVSKISNLNFSSSIPLPWFFCALPKTLLGKKYFDKSLVLIKILDPDPVEVKGDLYYELHEVKNEVYVVTNITAREGNIKIGIDPKKLKQYKNNLPKLKEDFYKAIKEYETVRRQIDSSKELDISPNLIWEEKILRKKMDDFTGMLKLNVGDVIAIPTLVPHALQNGVRVIEFQTATYERLIISFAQKVLTQNHWDTEKAFEKMKLTAPKKSSLKVLVDRPQYFIELVCSFKDFYSVRVLVKDENSYELRKSDFYKVVFIVQGQGNLMLREKDYILAKDQCLFIPAGEKFSLNSKNQLIFLICSPKKFTL